MTKKFDDSYDYPDIVAPGRDLSDEHREAVMPDYVKKRLAERAAKKDGPKPAKEIASAA